jgi:hypothetical protein
MSKLIDGVTKFGTFKGIIFCFTGFLIGFIMVLFMKEDKRR